MRRRLTCLEDLECRSKILSRSWTLSQPSVPRWDGTRNFGFFISEFPIYRSRSNSNLLFTTQVPLQCAFDARSRATASSLLARSLARLNGPVNLHHLNDDCKYRTCYDRRCFRPNFVPCRETPPPNISITTDHSARVGGMFCRGHQETATSCITRVDLIIIFCLIPIPSSCTEAEQK